MKQLISHIMQQGWIAMMEQVIPSDTHPDLVKTYKRFYMAGGQRAIHSLVYEAGLEDGAEPTEDDLSKVDALLHEFQAFFNDVKSGRQ